MVRFSGGWVSQWVGGSANDGRIGGGGFCCAKSMVGGPACEWVSKDESMMSGLAATVGGCGGCGGWRQLCFDFGGFLFFLFIFYFYKVVLVDVGLCPWWLSALLQPRWLCHCY